MVEYAGRALTLAFLAMLILSLPSAAHDQWGNPNWIAKGNFYSPIDGSHCCGLADCAVVDEKSVTEVAGGLHIVGTVTYGSGAGAVTQELNETVPHKEIQISRDGHYWRCKKPDGSRRCFFAPPPST